MSIFRAKVLTSSEADDLHRVKITAPGYFVESPLIEVLNNIPLNVDDIVLVSDAAGFESPLIIGRCFSTSSQSSDLSPALTDDKYFCLFRSQSDSSVMECWVNSSEFYLRNDKLLISIIGDTLSIGTDDAKVKVSINGGSNGGLINIDDLTKSLNDLVDAYNKHTHSVTFTTGALGSATTQAASSASKFNSSDYVDSNISH